MNKRRSAWRLVVQALYSWEINPLGRNELEQLSWLSCYDQQPEEEVRAAVILLLRCWEQQQVEIDRIIADHLINWHFSRLYLVDRALLRLGTLLLLHQRQLPAALVLNETVTLAKELGTEDSYRLLNGVLNNIAGFAGNNEEGNASTDNFC